MSRVGPSLDNADVCTSNNIVGTQNILNAARDAGITKVVYAGSSTYYGNQAPPHKESMPGEFLNPYSLSKYVGEEYCLLYDRMFNLPTVIMRYFNVYGDRQPQVGAYALVLGIFLRQYAMNEPLTIHGIGDQRRDFVHVRDVVNATIAAFESNVRHAVFNVGSGTNTSIKELADLISSRQTFGPRRPGDAQDTLADISLARKMLNWAPQISMEQGLREMLDALTPAAVSAVVGAR
jgi:UDP-glucose 4-epimerase